eukprot:gene1359-4535_t
MPQPPPKQIQRRCNDATNGAGRWRSQTCDATSPCCDQRGHQRVAEAEWRSGWPPPSFRPNRLPPLRQLPPVGSRRWPLGGLRALSAEEDARRQLEESDLGFWQKAERQLRLSLARASGTGRAAASAALAKRASSNAEVAAVSAGPAPAPGAKRKHPPVGVVFKAI